MALVCKSFLLAAGLLASPALAEVTGLRGSLEVDLAAEEDRPTPRALRRESRERGKGGSRGSGGSGVAFNKKLTSGTTVASESTNVQTSFTRQGPGEFEIVQVTTSNVQATSESGSEVIASAYVENSDAGEISGYYYNSKASEKTKSTDLRIEGVAANEEGITSEYYYDQKTDNEESASETNSHAYEVELSIPATTVPP